MLSARIAGKEMKSDCMGVFTIKSCLNVCLTFSLPLSMSTACLAGRVNYRESYHELQSVWIYFLMMFEKGVDFGGCQPIVHVDDKQFIPGFRSDGPMLWVLSCTCRSRPYFAAL